MNKNLILKYVPNFLQTLYRKSVDNELYFLGNELTYKMLLATFPLIIFLVQILIAMNLDYSYLFSYIRTYLPMEVSESLMPVVEQAENINSASTKLISISLILTIISASSGFNAIIRGINKTYNTFDSRTFIHRRILSIILVVQFVFSMICSLIFLIYGDAIISLFNVFGLLFNRPNMFVETVTYITIATILTINLMLIYKLSSCKKITIKSTTPGSIFTVVFWLISSKLFNIYVNNYGDFSAYGSIASIIILIFWINIIAIVLLVGSQINALLYEKKYLS